MTEIPFHILFIEAYDSFSNNIISLLECLPVFVRVSVIYIDSPKVSTKEALRELLGRHDAVVCGPGPGNPCTESDVGIMKFLWELGDEGLRIPVLGICLGFQSAGGWFGGKVRRLRGGLHGMVRALGHRGEDIFEGVGDFSVTLYHSLCVDLGQDTVSEAEWETWKWADKGDIVPLAWVTEPRTDGEERILMGFRHKSRPIWGLQYHPESACTDRLGDKVLENWVWAAKKWNVEHDRIVRHVPVVTPTPALPASIPAGSTPLRTRPTYTVRRLPLPSHVTVTSLISILGCQGKEQILLDSANHTAHIPHGATDVRGSHSILALDVESAVRFEYDVHDGTLRRVQNGVSSIIKTETDGVKGVWQYLKDFHAQRQVSSERETPFLGGFMGYLTYEFGLANLGVPLPKGHRNGRRADLAWVWVTQSIVMDHRNHWLDIQELSDIPSAWCNDIANKLLSSRTFSSATVPPPGLVKPPTPQSTQQPSEMSLTRPHVKVPSHNTYAARVTDCQSLIAAGESYELCLTGQTTIRLSRTTPSTRLAMFSALRELQPTPFASYIHLGSATLVGASPERFLKSDREGRCLMRPMKGTVRKSEGVSTTEQAKKLLHTPKEIAENLMIVDLVRHDLQSVCRAGMVEATKLMQVEEYATVFTMVTAIEAQIDTERYTAIDALRAAFPPGSMTGAPKLRSCELLTGLEGGVERGLYSGVTGYLCASGTTDWSVTIRSLFRWEDEEIGEDEEIWRVGAGGAVTGLSTAEGETEEMYLKVAGPVESVEKMRSAGGCLDGTKDIHWID